MRWLAVPLLGFALVSLAVGLLAREETISPGAYPGGWYRLFFTDTLHLKAWFASAAVALACLQLVTAAWIFRKLPIPRPRWVPAFHRWTGRIAFLFTLPVAYHCIFLLGYASISDTRTLIHAILGTFVYGVFVAKVFVVVFPSRFGGWVLPILGSLLFTILLGLWVTSSLWFFSNAGVFF